MDKWEILDKLTEFTECLDKEIERLVSLNRDINKFWNFVHKNMQESENKNNEKNR